MVKRCLTITERRTFSHTLTVEAESDDRLEKILETVENDRRYAPECLDDYMSSLEQFDDLNILSASEDDDGTLLDCICDDTYNAPDNND